MTPSIPLSVDNSIDNFCLGTIQKSRPTEAIEPKAGRRISFAANDQFFEIPHINDLTKAEIQSVWISRSELKNIRQKCAVIVKVMDTESAAKNGVCFRGLDQNTPTYVAETMALRRQLYDAVHAIQAFQFSTGFIIPDLMAESCQKISEQSTSLARWFGIMDESNAVFTPSRRSSRAC